VGPGMSNFDIHSKETCLQITVSCSYYYLAFAVDGVCNSEELPTCPDILSENGGTSPDILHRRTPLTLVRFPHISVLPRSSSITSIMFPIIIPK
jgi:hypothetical protein